MGGSRGQFEQIVTMVLAGCRARLAEKGIDPEQIDLESTVGHQKDPFCGLETQYKQEKYFKDVLGLIVSIVAILMFLLQLVLGTYKPAMVDLQVVVNLNTKE